MSDKNSPSVHTDLYKNIRCRILHAKLASAPRSTASAVWTKNVWHCNMWTGSTGLINSDESVICWGTERNKERKEEIKKLCEN